MTAVLTDPRIGSAIATRGEVSNLLEINADKLTAWTRTDDRQVPLVHTARGYGRFTIPLVGIAEASALDALRSGGMSMQQVRKAADFIRREYGDEYAIASPRFFTDGTEAFIRDDFGFRRLRDGQGAFSKIIADHLRPLIIGPDGLVEAFHVEQFTSSQVTIDPRYNAGRMSFTRNRIPLFAVAGALRAGERTDHVAVDFDLERNEVDEVAQRLDWLATVT